MRESRSCGAQKVDRHLLCRATAHGGLAGASSPHGCPKVSGPYSLLRSPYSTQSGNKKFFCVYLELRLGTFTTKAILEGRLKSRCFSQRVDSTHSFELLTKLKEGARISYYIYLYTSTLFLETDCQLKHKGGDG